MPLSMLFIRPRTDQVPEDEPLERLPPRGCSGYRTPLMAPAFDNSGSFRRCCDQSLIPSREYPHDGSGGPNPRSHSSGTSSRAECITILVRVTDPMQLGTSAWLCSPAMGCDCDGEGGQIDPFVDVDRWRVDGAAFGLMSVFLRAITYPA